MKKIDLPRKSLSSHPGKALLQAVRDLEKCERSRRYVINMGTWHASEETYMGYPRHKCCVCLAGSVMAQTLGKSPSESVCPGDFDRDTERMLYGLNSARMGLWISFLLYFRIKPARAKELRCELEKLTGSESTRVSLDDDEYPIFLQELYSSCPGKFKSIMGEVARFLIKSIGSRDFRKRWKRKRRSK